MQIPILNGVYTDNSSDYRMSYPVNLIPIAQDTGINTGYLRPAYGLSHFTNTSGIYRGGINWRNEFYAVAGSDLIKVAENGTVLTLGTVANDGGAVKFDYSFDRLSIQSSNKLYYFNGSLSLVTDSDLGAVLDHVWADGYFVTTDGTSLVVTELTDPSEVNPLKYGSSESDPDPIKGLLRSRREVYALNRHTIEVFSNIGGELFPFQRVDGAQIQKGCVGTWAKCVFMDSIAFVGSGRNEQIGVYMALNGNAEKISSNEIDTILNSYSESELSDCYVECINFKGQNLLYIHLNDRTLLFNYTASKLLSVLVWSVLTSAIYEYSQYRARYFVNCYNKWLCGDNLNNRLGYLNDELSSHYGDDVRWQFGTLITYNEGNGALFNELELVALTGRTAFGENPQISTQYSIDGQTWSNDQFINSGKQGERLKRLTWFRQGVMRNIRMQRFRGDTQSFVTFARLEAQLEPLAW
jgi:hypothetical protein